MCDGHAYAIVPKEVVKALLNMRRYEGPIDCKVQCHVAKLTGEALKTRMLAHKIWDIASPHNPALRSATAYLPELGIKIRAPPDLKLSHSKLNKLHLDC